MVPYRPKGRRYEGRTLFLEFLAGSGLFLVLEFEDVGAGVGGAEEPVREEMQKDGTEKFIYEIDKNSDLAKNLKGHLMLTTGDMDENVSMVNTMHLANALIKADKRFELQVYPGMRHPYMPIVSYVDMARGDFFAHWLLGSSDTRADILELQNQKQATPSKKFKE